MSNFFKLLYNEQLKIYIRKSTWVMYILLAAIIIGTAFITNSFGDLNEEYQGSDWREVLQQKNDDMTKEMQEDEDMQGLHDYDITKNNYYLEHDLQPAKYDAWQFVMENKMLLSLVTLFTIIVSAGIVANEFKWGTIKLLLIRPISRTKILISKYISTLLFALFTLLAVLIFSWIVGAIFFGVNGINTHILETTMDGGFVETSVIKGIITGYGYQLVNLVVMATFAFMISTIFRQSSLAIGLAIFLMFAGSSIVGYFADKSFAKYILFANTDLSQYAHGAEPFIKGMSLGFSITVLIVYYIIFLIVSWLFFTKRDVAGQ
ncbi:ABC transporter permease [Lentibacillus sp. N15]|uniref:ABC transporter permease n=1 Tax=Lentibacillus songyuanensis TaxID=3136161 RepID=UPI0031BAE4A5